MSALLQALSNGAPIRLRAQTAVAAAVARFPSPVRPLAPPPAGSRLAPILGMPGPPLIGYSLNVTIDMLGMARQRYEQFGEVFWMGGLGTRIVTALGPEAIGEVLANRDRAFSNQSGWGYLIGPFFHGGVMLMDFDEHRHHRRIMQHAFRHEQLVGYLEAMNPCIAKGLRTWRPANRFAFYPAAKQLTLDLATRVFMGEEPGAEADRVNHAFVDAVHGGVAMVRADVPGGVWRRGLRGRAYLERYFRARVAAKRAAEGRDLFSVLCRAESEDGHRFGDEDVVSHMIFLMMAAHDTSTITLSTIAYLLGRHPEWQERLRAESRALGRAEITHDDLEALPSMDLVFKEALRLYAPVGMLARRATVDASIRGCYVPAGTLVGLAIYPSQRMEPWWSDPDRFDPERFADHRREDRSHPHAWIPFGGYAHKCIGMHFGGVEVKAILHQLLLSFAWSVPDGYEPPIGYGTGPLPADGLPIALRRIS